jgi:hypothetical protein
MQPWTAPSLLKAAAAPAATPMHGLSSPLGGAAASAAAARARSYGPEWECWVLACEDVYTAPLLPFLQRMGSLDYGGAAKRDAQLKACEAAMEVFKGPLLEVLRRSPTEALRRALEAQADSLAPLGQVDRKRRC